MAHYRASVVWLFVLSGCLALCGVLTSVLFSSRGPAVYLISAHSEPTCAHSISGPRASTPVQTPVAPAAIILTPSSVVWPGLRRNGRRRVHDVSFLWLPVDQHQGQDMTGSGEPIPPRPFLIPHHTGWTGQNCTTLQRYQFNSPCPFSDLHFCASGQARPVCT